jgi:hypothetical protein
VSRLENPAQLGLAVALHLNTRNTGSRALWNCFDIGGRSLPRSPSLGWGPEALNNYYGWGVIAMMVITGVRFLPLVSSGP